MHISNSIIGELKMDRMIKYSVVITIFNDEDRIIGLLKNIENQTVKPQEVVIADGGSSDGSLLAISEYAQTSDIDIILLDENKRLNIAQGLNLAISRTRNEFIGIVACGNTYEVDFFERLIKDFDIIQELDIAYGSLKGVGNTAFSRKYIQNFHRNGNYLEKFPTNHGCLVRRQVFDDFGLFYEHFYYAGEDREFFQRIEDRVKWFGDKDAVISWEIPDTINDYYRQQRVYIIGDMQMYENQVIFKTHWKRFAYISAWIVLFLLLIVPPIRILSIIPAVYLLYRNISKVFGARKEDVGLYNLDIFLKVWIVVRNSKYLLRKNKMKGKLLKEY